MAVRVSIQGDAEAIQKLRKLGNGLTDLSGAMKLIGTTLAAYYASTGFTDQGAPFNASWPALSQGYLAWKQKKYPGRPMLVRTGKMQRSFYSDSTKDSVTIGNRADYFVYHQSTEPRKRLPWRPTMGVNGSVKTTVAQIIERDLRTKLMAAGLV